MAINVIDHENVRQQFHDATTWHIDERGQLHLSGASGQVASFSREGWLSVGTHAEGVAAPVTERRLCDGENHA